MNAPEPASFDRQNLEYKRTSILLRGKRVAALIGPLVTREIRSRYRTSALDVAWALVNPLVTMAVYGLVLTRGFGVESQCGPYIVSAWSGLVLWVFVATSLTTSVVSIISAPSLVTKVYFPREVLPLAATVSAMIDLAVGLLTVVVLLLLSGVGLSAYSALAVLPVAMLMIWAAALGVLSGALAVFARDMVHVVQLVTRVGIFAVPVFYDERILPDPLGRLVSANPVTVAIVAFRSAVLCGQPPELEPLAIHASLGVCLLVASILYVRHIESRIADFL